MIVEVMMAARYFPDQPQGIVPFIQVCQLVKLQDRLWVRQDDVIKRINYDRALMRNHSPQFQEGALSEAGCEQLFID
jgi:hypothetical protein